MGLKVHAERCIQKDASRKMHPERCIQEDASRKMHPGRCIQKGVYPELKMRHSLNAMAASVDTVSSNVNRAKN